MPAETFPLDQGVAAVTELSASESWPASTVICGGTGETNALAALLPPESPPVLDEEPQADIVSNPAVARAALKSRWNRKMRIGVLFIPSSPKENLRDALVRASGVPR